MRFLQMVLMIVVLAPTAASAQESGVALKPDTVRAEPYTDAKAVGDIKKGTSVAIFRRSGGWYEIKAGSTRGWVRMLSIKRGAASSSGAASELAGVAALSSGRAGTGQIVSTTGVRGLSAEELRGAKFDAQQLNKAESFAVSKADAQAYARSGALQARRVEYLPAPKN